MSDPLVLVPLAALAGVLILGALVYVTVLVLPSGSKHRGLDKARVSARQWGQPKDRVVKPLVISGSSEYDRITLGRLAKATVAAPPRASVALVAPTMAGKTTTFMVPRIIEWKGAMVSTSAKADLVRLTMAHRQRQGPVWVFDPLGFLETAGITSCRWSPLIGVRTYADALVSASWIASTSNASEGSSNQKFWDENAKRMLSPLIFAAAQQPYVDEATGEASHSQHISQVGRWLQHGRESDAEVQAVLRRTGDRDAIDALAALQEMHDQTRKNIAATAQVVLDPFSTPRTRPALTPSPRASENFDPARLLDEGGTLYVFAPEHEAQEFKALFEALINTVVFEAQDRSARLGGLPIAPHHLLLALDEAANMASLTKLPQLASVGSSQGIVLLSVWQNLSQIESIYGRDGSRTLLAGHNAKLFWGGIHDPETLRLVDDLCGEFEHRRETRSSDGRSRSTSSTTESQRLAPASFTRALPRRTVLAVVTDGKPLLLNLTPWFEDPQIRTQIDPAVAAEFDSAFGSGPRKVRVRG